MPVIGTLPWIVGATGLGAATFMLASHNDKLADASKDAGATGTMVSAYFTRDIGTFGAAGLGVAALMPLLGKLDSLASHAPQLRVIAGTTAVGAAFLAGWSVFESRKLHAPAAIAPSAPSVPSASSVPSTLPAAGDAVAPAGPDIPGSAVPAGSGTVSATKSAWADAILNTFGPTADPVSANPSEPNVAPVPSPEAASAPPVVAPSGQLPVTQTASS